jgi:hypothetical protein
MFVCTYMHVCVCRIVLGLAALEALESCGWPLLPPPCYGASPEGAAELLGGW